MVSGKSAMLPVLWILIMWWALWGSSHFLYTIYVTVNAVFFLCWRLTHYLLWVTTHFRLVTSCSSTTKFWCGGKYHIAPLYSNQQPDSLMLSTGTSTLLQWDTVVGILDSTIHIFFLQKLNIWQSSRRIRTHFQLLCHQNIDKVTFRGIFSERTFLPIETSLRTHTNWYQYMIITYFCPIPILWHHYL